MSPGKQWREANQKHNIPIQWTCLIPWRYHRCCWWCRSNLFQQPSKWTPTPECIFSFYFGGKHKEEGWGYLSGCADPKRVFNNLQPNAAPCLNRPFAGRQETAGMLNFLHQQRRGGRTVCGSWFLTPRHHPGRKNSRKMYVREHVSSFHSKGCNLSLNLYLMWIKLYYMGNLGVLPCFIEIYIINIQPNQKTNQRTSEYM